MQQRDVYLAVKELVNKLGVECNQVTLEMIMSDQMGIAMVTGYLLARDYP